MPVTVLITGFGPFPGAPSNPTERLVQRLALLRRPGLADVRLVPHVFATSYRAVECDLPRLLAQHAPDAILMFGLAARRRKPTVETRARNAVSLLLADARGALMARRAIAPREPSLRPFPAWVRSLVPAIRRKKLPARLSHDAGRYLCNYLCWQTLAAAAMPNGPLVAFVHVPQLRRTARPILRGHAFAERDLIRAGEALLMATAAAARRHRIKSSQGGVRSARHSSDRNAA